MFAPHGIRGTLANFKKHNIYSKHVFVSARIWQTMIPTNALKLMHACLGPVRSFGGRLARYKALQPRNITFLRKHFFVSARIRHHASGKCLELRALAPRDVLRDRLARYSATQLGNASTRFEKDVWVCIRFAKKDMSLYIFTCLRDHGFCLVWSGPKSMICLVNLCWSGLA